MLNDTIINAYVLNKEKLDEQYQKTTILLFRIGNEYFSYFEDANILAKLIGIEKVLEDENNSIYSCKFNADDLESNTKKICQAGYGFNTIDAIDSKGNYILNAE
ncbi:MAG: hypothetical protein LIP06_14500 [Tannerellaceae bacterium]|nr:hypothetical protein [Tannerellaceae bacterium]